MVGGFFSAQRNELAHPPRALAVQATSARFRLGVARPFRAVRQRKLTQQERLMYLIDEFGLEPIGGRFWRGVW